MARTRWRMELDRLRQDNRSGSAEIEARALEVLIEVVSDSSVTSSADGYRRWLLRIGRELVAAQPAMAALFRLVNGMLWAAHEATDGATARARALRFLQEYQARTEAALESLAQKAAEYLARFPVIMTYSRSSTVARALTAMVARGVKPRILCSEGRPMLEGQALASELGWAGIEVVLGIDMALFGWLAEASALVIGADSVSASGIVNKIGTAALVRAAEVADIPRLVLCTSNKFLPNEYMLSHALRSGNPDEIMPISSKNVTVRNVYFDVTPLDGISMVFTEEGPQERAALGEQLAQVRVYPGLRGR